MSTGKLTIGEVSRVLSVTTVTIRNYINILGDRFLSAESTRKTGKRFSAGDTATLQKFHTLLSEGVTYEKALERLPTIPEIVENTTGSAEEPAGEPSQSAIQTLDILEKFQALLQLQQEQNQKTIQAKDEHIETLKAENLRLQEEVNQLKKPWFKKLFTR
jgi:DNA-binding transcriptional MerR regulator